ncbi:MAG TPA: hypothetical protein VGL88_10690, partial [Pseudonocardiaceae bacterium]
MAKFWLSVHTELRNSMPSSQRRAIPIARILRFPLAWGLAISRAGRGLSAGHTTDGAGRHDP